MSSAPQGPPPPFEPVGRGEGTQPFDPANRHDPRYDPRRDPRGDARWQREQSRAWQRNQKLQAEAWAAQQKAAIRLQREGMRQQARMQREQIRAQRRSLRAPSVIGPLLLIAFAVVVLLVHDGRIGLPALLVWYGRWWPLLLIAVGVLRLAEWGIDRAFGRREAMPVRYSVGGGVVFLIVVLAFAGLAARQGIRRNAGRGIVGFGNGSEFFGFARDDWQQFLESKHEEDSPAAVRAIAMTGSLLIQDPHGDVTVTGTSPDGMVHLSVHKKVFTASDEEARRRLQGLEPVFSGTAETLILRVNGPNDTRDGADSADLVLLVPAGVRVSVNANHGDVRADNLRAAATVTANHGDVEIRAVTGAVTVRVNSRSKSVTARSIDGDVTVDGTGDEVNLSDVNGAVRVSGDFFGGGRLLHVTGPVDYRTGRVTFALARLDGEVAFDDHDEFSATEATGPFRVETRSRDLTLTRIGGEVHVTNSHGKVELVAVPPGGAITVNNHDGDVRLTLPQSAKFTVAAETSDGDVSSNFTVAGRTEAHGTLNGTVGGGGTAVRLTTTHGDIALNHAGEVGMMPVPKPPMVPRVGFGTVAPPLPPPGALPPEAVQAIRDAHAAVTEAQVDVQEAAREAQQQAKEAMQEAKEKTAEAQRLGEEARRQGLLQSAEVRRQALQQAEEARQQAAEARRAGRE